MTSWANRRRCSAGWVGFSSPLAHLRTWPGSFTPARPATSFDVRTSQSSWTISEVSTKTDRVRCFGRPGAIDILSPYLFSLEACDDLPPLCQLRAPELCQHLYVGLTGPGDHQVTVGRAPSTSPSPGFSTRKPARRPQLIGEHEHILRRAAKTMQRRDRRRAPPRAHQAAGRQRSRRLAGPYWAIVGA